MTLSPADRIDPYELLAVLSRSPSGATWRACDAGGEVVLLEIACPLTDAGARARAVERFRNEVEALRRLAHPAFARTVGTFSARGRFFVAREWVPGATLAELAAQAGGRLPEGVVLGLADELLAAFVDAHAADPPVLIRDVRPEHAVVSGDGTVRWIGFGLRPLLAPRRPSTGILMRGDTTSPYAAFEQRTGAGSYDASSEVYALAATLYHLVVGTPPPDPDVRLFGREHLRLDGVSPRIGAVLRRALSLDASDRQPSVAAFRADLIPPRAEPTIELAPAREEATVELLPAGGQATAEILLTEPLVAESPASLMEPLVAEAPAFLVEPVAAESPACVIEPAVAESPASIPGPSSPAARLDPQPVPPSPPSSREGALLTGDGGAPVMRLTPRRPPASPRQRAVTRFAQVASAPRMATTRQPELRVSPRVVDFGGLAPTQSCSEWIFLENAGGGHLQGSLLTEDPALHLSSTEFSGNDARVELRVNASRCLCPGADLAVPLRVSSNGGDLEVIVRYRVQPGDNGERVLIPEGEFLMGSDDEAFNERPRHLVHVAAFEIDRYPVTNAQYRRFVEETGYQSQGAWESFARPGRDRHPVVAVTWKDACVYAEWSGGRLPSEAEWERASRGTDGRTWPWGSLWDTSRLNCRENSVGTTTPVDAYPHGASAYGVMDMAGNVWEWTLDAESDYPYRRVPVRRAPRVVRGGSFLDPIKTCRCGSRAVSDEDSMMQNRGFRTVRTP